MSTIREMLLELPIDGIEQMLTPYFFPYIIANPDVSLVDYIPNIKVIEHINKINDPLLTKLATPLCFEEIVDILRYEYDPLSHETIPELHRIQECFRGLHMETLSFELLKLSPPEYVVWYKKYGATLRNWYTKYGDISLTFRGIKPKLFTSTTSLPHFNPIDMKKRNESNLKLSITSMNSRKRVSILFFYFFFFLPTHFYSFIFFIIETPRSFLHFRMEIID
jgi:hypothetical protein